MSRLFSQRRGWCRIESRSYEDASEGTEYGGRNAAKH